jgi:acyl carrier protein
MSQAIESVSNFIVTEIMHGSEGDSLDPQLGLLEEGIIDSLGLQQIITFIEQQFKVTIDDDDLLPENFESVNAIAELIGKFQ